MRQFYSHIKRKIYSYQKETTIKLPKRDNYTVTEKRHLYCSLQKIDNFTVTKKTAIQSTKR